MFIEAVNTLNAATKAYEYGKKSQPLLGKLVRRIRDQKLNIVICGAGGTGKSTLGRLLSGEFGRQDILQPYQISFRSEKLELDSETSTSVLVLPGQSEFWGEELKKIANNRVDLLINVVSYGYHSIMGQFDYQSILGYKQGMTPREVIFSHIEGKQPIETELLHQLKPHLSIANKKKVLMITLVTKQDLWWLNRQEVKKHYEIGEYNNIVQEIRGQLGQSNFSHAYFSASLLTENFRDVNGEIMAPVSEGYDQKTQLINFDQLLYFIENNLDLEIRR
jgi:GTPase SAR1 family protein